jgi:hypothetical protein
MVNVFRLVLIVIIKLRKDDRKQKSRNKAGREAAVIIYFPTLFTPAEGHAKGGI